MQKQIIITGFGGQGVVLAGRILGKAAALGDKRKAPWCSPTARNPGAAPAAPR